MTKFLRILASIATSFFIGFGLLFLIVQFRAEFYVNYDFHYYVLEFFNYVLTGIFILSIIFLFVGLFAWIKHKKSNPKKASRGCRFMFWSVMGFALVIGAWVYVSYSINV